QGVPVTLQRGQYYDVRLGVPAQITANSPILVAQFPTGFHCLPGADGDACNGNGLDPNMMLLTPSDQFLDNYTTMSPEPGAAWFDRHYVRVLAASPIAASIRLDGNPIPAQSFQAIGSSGFVGAQVQVTAGPHRLTGSGPFG